MFLYFVYFRMVLWFIESDRSDYIENNEVLDYIWMSRE